MSAEFHTEPEDGAPRVIEARGDPRAMGLEQGRACADAVRNAIARAGVERRGRLAASLRAFAAGPVLGAGMALEIVRHYPHLSERTQGIARGAGRSIESCFELLVLAAEGAAEPGATAPVPAGARCVGGQALLLRPVPFAAAPGAALVVRRSRPEVGFASVELTFPWLASCVAGVNELGLAAMIAPLSPAPGAARAPSALLLVQECLQRFRDVTGCIDWCNKRPASGAASLVIGDASGNLAAVEIDADTRRVLAPAADVLVAGGRRDAHPSLRKQLESGADADGLGVALGARLLIEPGERRLRLLSSGGAASGSWEIG